METLTQAHATRAGRAQSRPRLRAAIVGATGYVGGELVRLLARHPGVEITALVARNRDGAPLADTFPHLDPAELTIGGELPRDDAFEVVFIALPHGQASELAPGLLERGATVVDMGPDFRLASADAYREWYGTDHGSADLLPRGPGREAAGGRIEPAVYGLPELHRAELPGRRLIASPGCYPTATLLALTPLARAGLISDLVVDAKSGVSGAGREPKLEMHFTEIDESVRAYGLGGHRHLAELQQELALLGVAKPAIEGLVFTPHLVPMARGILSTCYVRPAHPVTQADLDELYRAAYAKEPFVIVSRSAPATKTVAGSNQARVFAALDERSGRIVAIGAIDNLVKGAAGQAIQAFNVAFGLDEAEGLAQLPLYP